MRQFIHRARLSTLGAGVLLLTGLALLPAQGEAGSRPKSGASTSSTATAPAAPMASSGPIGLVGAPDVKLVGTYLAGKERGAGAVLLHMDGRTQEDWQVYAERLSRQGFHTVTLDLRGHGQSTRLTTGEALPYEKLDDAQFQLMVRDVEAAVQFLRRETQVNPDAISLIGASLGANLALKYAASDPRIRSLILLSPGLEYKGISSEDAVVAYGERPLLMAVSREDSFAAKSALVLDALALGPKRLEVYSGAGNGTRMMVREPGLEVAMTQWLNGNYNTEDDDPAPTTSAPPVLRR